MSYRQEGQYTETKTSMAQSLLPSYSGLWVRPRWGWKRRDGFFFGFIFCLLLLHPLLNGYPFLFGDSWAYCCKCPDTTRSPVLGCMLRPIVLAAGSWGYIVAQCAATALAFTFLSSIILKRNHPYALIVSLLISGAGVFAGWILADIWTLIGLICLFAISIGYAFPVIALLLSIACSTHFGNFPTFSAAALMVLPLVREKAKFTLRISLCLLAALGLVAAANLFGGGLKLGSGNGLPFLACRIMHDMPELVEDICREDPSFDLCQRRDDIRHWSETDPETFIWSLAGCIDFNWPHFNDISRKIIVYSISRFPGYYFKHLTTSLGNTLKLFSYYKLSDGHVPYWQDPYVFDSMQECFPEDSKEYLKSWQGSGRLQGLLKRVDTPLTVLFWMSTLTCLASAMACWRTRHNDTLIQLAMFALIAVVVNAFLMSNLSGVFSRYHTRLGFLLIFPGTALMSRWFNSLIEKIQEGR
jgi:hypothetical protein